MRVLVFISMVVLSLFACHVEQNETSGESKKLVGRDSGDEEEGGSCSLFLHEDRAKQKELQEQAREDMRAADMPVPNNFKVYEVTDDSFAAQNNQEAYTETTKKNIIVSDEASKLILNECIECFLLCGTTSNGVGWCKFQLKLKDGEFSFASDNPNDTFVLYGAGETNVSVTETLEQGNRTVSRTKKAPTICTFGEKQEELGEGAGSSGIERSCVGIHVDEDTCKEAGYIGN